MRNWFTFIALGAVLALVSCGKDHPKPLDLPGMPFEAELTEVRSSKTFHWQVRQDASGNWITDNGEESVRTLYVTAYNSPVVLETTSDVNIESSNAQIIAVERAAQGNNRRFHLIYKGEGWATVRLWNGEGAAGCEKTFGVAGTECVDVTGIRFTYGGNPLVITRSSSSRPKILAQEADLVHEDDNGWSNPTRPKTTDFTWHQYMKPNIYDEEKQTFVIDPTEGALLRFEGLEPENTSFRTITAFESEWDFWRDRTRGLVALGIIQPGEYANWPNVRDISEDISAFEGREIWVAELGAPTYVASICVKARRDKYFWLYYSDAGEAR